MDTSDTYIKMHLALPDELKQEPSEGDYFYNLDTGEAGKLGEVYFDTSKLIRLYEQDQLQDMVKDNWAVWWLERRFHAWFSEVIWGREHPFTSMEQLWLAFVIKELHQKKWDGKHWQAE